MITSSSETHTATTIPESLQTHVRGFLAAARVCVRGARGAGAGRVKAAVAVIVAALLAGGLVAPAGGSSVRGAFANLQLVSSVPGELTISWDLPDPSPSDYRIMWAEEGLEFLSYRFANEALRGNEYPDGEATSVTLTGLTEGATYKVKARSRYSSGGWNNSRWSGPWSNEVTASVSVAAPVAQEPDDEQQQVDDSQTQGDDQQGQGNDEQQQVDDSQTQGNDQQGDDSQTQGNDQQQQVDDPQTQGDDEQQQVDDSQTQGNDQQGDDSQTQGNDQQQQVDDPQTQGDDEQQQVDDSQTQGNDQQGDDSQTQGNDQQRDDSSVVSGESVEAGETVSEDGVSRSEPVGGDLSAGTDTAGAVAADSAARGTISEGFSLWDADWFAAELVAGSTYVIEVLGAGSGADCTLRGPVLERVHDADGTPVTGTETWDDGRDSLTKLTFTPASSGTHFISVAGEANAAGTGTYILALTAAGPRSSERVAAIGAEGCVPTAPDNNATAPKSTRTATDPTTPKKTPKPPPENDRITARSHNNTVTFASNTARPASGYVYDISIAGFDQAFTTGPNEPGQNGYVLTKLEFITERLYRSTVSIWTDSSGSRGEKLAERNFPGGSIGGELVEVVSMDGLYVFLLPETKYWIRFESVGWLSLSITDTDAEDSDTLAGWSIEGLNRIRLSGFATDRLTVSSSEPSGGDLPASEDTTGVVSFGQVASGSLSDAADRDWFKLQGLQVGHLYRVEVDFLGDGVIGGAIQMQQSTRGRPPVARSDEWDSNYDGNAVIDFKPIQSESVVTKWIMIESDNGLNRIDDLNRFTGDYTVTLTDITGLRTMVANTEQREDDRLTHSIIGHLADVGLEGHVRLIANMFTTGDHAAGYRLDSITAYIRPGRTAASTTIRPSITGIVDPDQDEDQGADRISISNEHSVDITLTTSTIVSTSAEPAVSIHSTQISGGEDEPNNSARVCTLEPLDGYETGLGLPTGDWPDRFYAGDGDCADITLDPDTNYWILFHTPEFLPTLFYNVARANSTDEDPGSATGWSIGNYAKLREHTDIPSTGWIERTYALAFGIQATPK